MSQAIVAGPHGLNKVTIEEMLEVANGRQTTNAIEEAGVSDDFEKALDEAKKFDEHKDDIGLRSDRDAYRFRQGAHWARDWLTSRHKLFEDYETELQKLREENERLKEQALIEFDYRKELVGEIHGLEARNAELVEALEFYKKPENIEPHLRHVNGAMLIASGFYGVAAQALKTNEGG